MRLASALAVLLLASPAIADDDDDKPDPKTQLTAQLAAEMQTIETTLATVGDKLSAADAQRLRRIRAAYRILRAPLPSEASDTDRMASARRRAAARLLLERDRAERTLLASETEQLTAARTTKITANEQIPTLTLPDEIGRPAKGEIARRFGTYEHERSKATLSRRGLDFECDHHAPASAPADGVVRYAGPIRGLDHGVILDHGDYLTVVAKLGELKIPVGTRVARGDRLGRAARYRVYLEVRAKVAPGGLPIDPEPLLAD
ncbi:MAG TPA: M23 family metallopeptidase [Kofleriaceae bacterium]